MTSDMKKKRYEMPQVTAIAMEAEGPLLGPSGGEPTEHPQAAGYYSDQAQMSRRKSIWDCGLGE